MENPAEKQIARDYIIKTFKDHGLDTWTEEFSSYDPQVNQPLTSRHPSFLFNI